MVKKVKTEAELGEALKNNEESIEIEGDLAKKNFQNPSNRKSSLGRMYWCNRSCHL